PFLPGGMDANVPLIWRTTDGGNTWTKITNGLPNDQRTGSYVNVVREDPKQPGLLFCGTESAVYVSFHDGNQWQPLQLNMPTTSVRDLRIHTFDHENDLVAGTFGRGFWVLDDITPLQQITTSSAQIAAAPAYLFTPGDAIRSRVSTSWDQPVEPWEHHSLNPPYGAYIYYYLGQAPSGPISLRIYASDGRLVDTITSTLPSPITGNAYPRYWLASPQSRALTTHLGTNRFVWNLHFAPPLAFRHDLENQMDSVEHATTPGPKGPQVIPGVYTVKLTVSGQTYTRKLTVINDPRIGQGPDVMAALEAQNSLNLRAYDAMNASYQANQQVAAASRQVAAILHGGSAPADVTKQAEAIEAKLKTFGGKPPSGGFAFFRRRRPKPGAMQSFIDSNNNFSSLVSMVQVGLDMAPTPAEVGTWEGYCKNYNRTVEAWNHMQSRTLVAFNNLLNQNHLQPITVSNGKLADPSCSFHAK
ncbi:MAG: WD40/YVTN/BNR-like repeat-containing protein, partial [Terriglobales bacterium]